MKKIIFFIIIVITLLVLSVSTWGQQKKTEPLELKKISAELYELKGGVGANGGVCITADGILFVDAKMDQASVEQELAAVRALSTRPIRFLVNTHSDNDHVGGNQFFPSGVLVIAHENCRKEFFHPKRDGSPSDWLNPDMAPFIPSLTYDSKMDIYLGPKKVELWYFGIGHTTGDTVVYFPDEKTAFIGDQTFITRPQLIHAYKGGNSFEHDRTLNRMLDKLPAEHFCTGHETMTDRQGIRTHLTAIQAMQEKIKGLIAAGKTLDEVKKEFSEAEWRLVETIYQEIKK